MAEMNTDVEKRKEQEKNLLMKLADLGGQRVQEDALVFEGSKFVLPKAMSVPDGIQFLQDYQRQNEEEHNFSHTFKYRPWDGACAFHATLKKVFGTTGFGAAIQTMFGDIKPDLISIEVDVEQTVQVPWGLVQLPMLQASCYLDSAQDKELGLLFQLNIEAPRKYARQIEGLFIAIEEELRSNSIYKGKGIDGKRMPSFLDLRGIDPDKVIYAEETMAQLEANIWSLLDHTEEHLKAGLPLKRAVLVEGPYGTGKSLAGALTAMRARANGWTFIQCRAGKDDPYKCLATARLYEPSVVFIEDVDNLANPSQDEDEISKLLDVFDGIGAKGTKLMCVMTTNHPERIHKGMLRPGRLDAVIHIGSLDGPGIERLIEASVPAHLFGEYDPEPVIVAMDGYVPAFAKEAIDRAVRYSIARGGDAKLTTEDYVHAANGLRPQLELMEGASEGETDDSVGAAISRSMEQVVGRFTLKNVGEPFAKVSNGIN